MENSLSIANNGTENNESDEQVLQALELLQMMEDAEAGKSTKKNKSRGTSTKKSDDKDNKDAKARKPKPKANKENKPKSKMDTVPELKIFQYLRRDLEVKVDFFQHDIKYKNQLWGVNGREVMYKLELVKGAKEAKDICSKFVQQLSEESKQLEKERATAGKVRYYKLVSFADNIPYRAKELAYIRVYPSKDGTMKTKTMLLSKVCADNNIGVTTLSERLEEQLRLIEKVH